MKGAVDSLFGPSMVRKLQLPAELLRATVASTPAASDEDVPADPVTPAPPTA